MLNTNDATHENGKGGVAAPPAGQLRVLFIDDDSATREIVTRCLEIDNHRVDLGADGEEGLRKFRANEYDLVITDWAMPGMYGDQVAATIKASNKGTPIIMLTGFADAIGNDGPPAGVDLVISKPVMHDTLRSAIKQVMRKTPP